MKNIYLTVIIISLGVATINIPEGQDLKSRSDFLEYELGTYFTYHHKVMDYFNYVDAQS